MKKSLPRRVTGLVGPAKAWYLSKVYEDQKRLLIVAPSIRAAEELSSDLLFFLKDTSSLFFFPAWDQLLLEPVSPDITVSARRIGVLNALQGSAPILCITSPEALLQRVLPAHLLEESALNLKVGTEIERSKLLLMLDGLGFTHAPRVESLGQVSVRGGVIDIFPPGCLQPLRVEFFDDMVEAIRPFNSDSQRSTATPPLSELKVLPLYEYIPFHARAGAEALMEQGIQRLKIRGQEQETPLREIAHLTGMIRKNVRFPGIELAYMMMEEYPSFFSLLPPSVTTAAIDELATAERVDSFLERLEDRKIRLESSQTVTPTSLEVFIPEKTFSKEFTKRVTISLDYLGVHTSKPEDESETEKYRTKLLTELTLQIPSRQGTGDGFAPLRNALAKWRKEGTSVAFVVGSDVRVERLERLLHEQGIELLPYTSEAHTWLRSEKRPSPAILRGTLSEGVFLDTEAAVLIAEHQLFPTGSKRHRRNKKRSLARIMSALASLSEGDLIVHVDYGIGLYQGLRHMEIEGTLGDFLQINYADSTLYLPVFNISRIHKYSGGEGQLPPLDKLSSTRWEKTKQRVREAVVSLAGDLIRLYAARSVAKGWRFEPMGGEDERFADSFNYDETPDQLKAIEETLCDMASERPMDRVICGDVGFGKTEVAIRAAFKCVEHRRQVAVLVPTTILVEQHKKSFQARFADYPVKIAGISRLYKTKELNETYKGLASGEIDIVIGTQKLLGGKVAFNDLGLLIVDEEHRFGVKQKERLKQFKKQIDILTLTATPIPRTLHMSLLGIRDISVITTPPVARRPTRTYLAHREPALLRDVIQRELQRNGQVFFVFNRVDRIDLVAAELSSLVPEARVAFAHGQMDEKELDAIMTRYLRGDIDVLVSTTIIESGIDIPNANTLVVDNAHMFGLAQLYQLRGRVGRSERQSYAYFLIPKKRNLTGEAQERLRVLQSLEDLGVGFHLALRDLEIRGAGNLLGKEQSGSVMSVGFDLYTRILQETVANLKGEDLESIEMIEPEIKLQVEAFIPSAYVPDISERLLLYQRTSNIGSEDEAQFLEQEIEDRFGSVLREVKNLLELMTLKGILRTFKVLKLEFSRSKLLLALSPQAPLDLDKILRLSREHSAVIELRKSLTLAISYTGHIEDIPGILATVTRVLDEVKAGQRLRSL